MTRFVLVGTCAAGETAPEGGVCSCKALAWLAGVLGSASLVLVTCSVTISAQLAGRAGSGRHRGGRTDLLPRRARRLKFAPWDPVVTLWLIRISFALAAVTPGGKISVILLTGLTEHLLYAYCEAMRALVLKGPALARQARACLGFAIWAHFFRDCTVGLRFARFLPVRGWGVLVGVGFTADAGAGGGRRSFKL